MKRRVLLLCAMVGLLVSCSEPPRTEKAKEPPKPVEPVTGRYAFQQVYITARTWAQDLQALRVTNVTVGTQTPPAGKSYAWAVTLVSPSKARQRTYTYSVLTQGSINAGTYPGLEEAYMQRGQARPWNTMALKFDSTDAYEVAQKKSADYIKKNPDKPLTFLLEMTPRHPNLAWRVIWGTSAATSNYSVYVDASTGMYLETMR